MSIDPSGDEQQRAGLHVFEAFGVLGQKTATAAPERFLFYLVDAWPTPSFSPLLLLPGRDLDAADLTQAEHLYSTIRCANPHVSDTPYLTFIEGDGHNDIAAIKACLDAAGWQKEEKPLAVNVFFKRSDMGLPAGHAADVVDVTNADLPACYLDLLRDGFAANDSYISYVRAALARSSARTQIVTIRNAGGAIVAGGAVSVRNAMGFLTWGTVANQWRDQGYHRILLNYCLGVATAADAEVNMLTTRNDRVRGRCDALIELHICRKVR